MKQAAYYDMVFPNWQSRAQVGPISSIQNAISRFRGFSILRLPCFLRFSLALSGVLQVWETWKPYTLKHIKDAIGVATASAADD